MLDPLYPSVIRAVESWSAADDRAVTLTHDRQNTLARRIEQLMSLTDGRLRELRLVESSADRRVQVTDFLAGIARKVWSDVLAGHADPDLVALLGPYVDPWSVWDGDRRPSGTAVVDRLADQSSVGS